MTGKGTETLWDDPHRGTGKPHKRVLARLADGDLDALTQHFPTAPMKAYYLAHVIETAACWPRVLNGTMTQERFSERTERMLAAILRVTKSAVAA